MEENSIKTTTDASELKEFIHCVESKIKDMDQVDIKTVHHFSNGVYAREITIPAGVVLTGKTHKEEHINIISKGTIRVMTENGLIEVSAPCTIISKPGVKRLGYAITETVWTTIHPNPDNIEDLEKLEGIFIRKDDDLKLDENEVNLCLG